MFGLEIVNTLRILKMHMGLNEYFFFNNRFQHHVAYMLKTTDQKRRLQTSAKDILYPDNIGMYIISLTNIKWDFFYNNTENKGY